MPEAGREMGAEMKKKQHITAFYMEMLVLITVFIVVILDRKSTRLNSSHRQ